MKTYWLEERENRKPLAISRLTPALHAIEKEAIVVTKTLSPIKILDHKPMLLNKRMSLTHNILTYREPGTPVGSSMAVAAVQAATIKHNNSNSTNNNSNTNNSINNNGSVEERPVYSPITFEDVARRSTANSPVKTVFSASSRGRESRSNSTGHVFMHSPSDVFGSLISDTEDFLEDLHINHRNSLGTNTYTSSSPSPSSPPFSPTPSNNLRMSSSATIHKGIKQQQKEQTDVDEEIVNPKQQIQQQQEIQSSKPVVPIVEKQRFAEIENKK